MTGTFGTKGTRTPPESFLPHQERVNLEMFKAIETLGKKLERSESERDRLARRLALIESSASVDEKTGRLYLPVAPGDTPPFAARPAPKWPVAAILANSAVALFTLGVVLFQQPPAPAQVLTPQQLAALNSLSTRKFSAFEDKAWQKLTEEREAASASAAAQVPDITAEVPTVAAETPPAVAAATPPPAPADASAPIPLVAPPAETAEAAPPPAKTEEQPAPPVRAAETKPAAPAPTEAKPAEIAKADPAPVITPEETAKPAETAPETAAAPPPATAPPQALASNGVAPDPELPAKLADLEKRAFQNVPEAQHDLATLYASGKIVAQDYKRAVYWFSKAADGGVANADYNLGVMFQQGLGVRQDVDKALGWYRRAAQLGHPEAMYNLGIAYIEGIGAPKDIEKGVAYFKSAANAGVAQAAYNLGVLYESNFVGSIDLKKALDWYQVAANEGHADAQGAVHRLQTQLAKADKPDMADDALAVADLVEPASGETGEGDSSPVDSNNLPPPVFKSTLVGKVQDALIARGLLPKSAGTGALDSVTSDAIRAWQAKHGMTADGQPSQALLDKLAAEKK